MPGGRGRGEAQDRDLVDRRGDVGRPERRSPRSADERTTRSASGSPTPSSPAPPAIGRSSMSAPIAPQDVDDRAARRVHADAVQAQLGVGMDRAGDQPEGRRRDVARDPSRRSPAPPALPRPSSATAPSGAVRLARPATPRARSIRSVWSRVATASRTVVRPSAREAREQDRRLHLRARHGRRRVDRPGAGCDRPRSAAGGSRSAAAVERGAHRAQRLDDTSHRTAGATTRRRRGRRSVGSPASMPAISRRLVPELPQSRIAVRLARGRRRPARRPGSRPGRPSLGDPLDASPRARATMPAVERTSAPSPAPAIRLSPLRPARPGAAPGG